MIQLNLLPDVKLDYIKAQRLRKMITSLSVLITIVSVGLLILMLGIGFAEKARIKSIDKSIKTKTAELKEKPQIDKVLTVQNQLNSLTDLHSSKPAVVNLFTYLHQVTPTQVSISNLNVDFAEGTEKMTITGTSDSLSSVNKYIDTLKFTRYTTNDNEESRAPFKDIVLSSFNLTTGTGQAGAGYTIDLLYEKEIFDITKKVKLNVPKQTTTRSTLDAPGNVFQPEASTETPATGGNR